jgi:hypothetical protein
MMQKNNFNFLNKKEKNGVTKNKALYIRLSIRLSIRYKIRPQR